MGEEQPIVLELAPLPREQVGPFLLLGLDKDAGAEQVEAHWARRVIWARKQQTDLALEEINWAREVLNDPERRALAAAAGLNLDTAAGTLRRLAEPFARPSWLPFDIDPPADAPAADVPDLDELRRATPVPDVPAEWPVVARLFDTLARAPLDPWAVTLNPDAAP